jgi:hypothetical protein
MPRVAIIQPSYIPWRGFFDIIQAVDVFVFLDDVQYTVRDWRNRNRIKTQQGSSIWLTVPTRGGRDQLIADVEIDDGQDWRRKHLTSLRYSYGRSPFFERYQARLGELLLGGQSKLADLDIALTQQICEWLGIERRFARATELGASGVKDDRLIELVRKMNGDFYLSGPSARDYIQPEKFQQAGIQLAYHDYSGYPEYPQIAPPFDPAVSVLDLLFAVGPEAPEYIWGNRRLRPTG